MLVAPPQRGQNEFAHPHEFLRQAVVELFEQFAMPEQFTLPLFAVDGHQLIERFLREIEAVPAEILVARHPADWTFDPGSAPAHSADHPLQDAHVLAVAGPDELSLFVLAEPVDAENPRRITQPTPHLQPMVEIVAHVVAAERQHRERIAPNLAHGAGRRSGGL